MATTIPQRELRNETAKLLRRVETGERLTITVHGHPVAELGPVRGNRTFIRGEDVVAAIGGLLDPRDDLIAELEMEDSGFAEDPFS